jgi:hexulose-6-phosphate isomerase
MEIARDCGLDAIEWIYDTHGNGANPIETDEGIAQISKLRDEHGLVVESICADWFMDEPLAVAGSAEKDAAGRRLEWLLSRAQMLGVSRMVLPFVDSSSLSSSMLRDQAVRAIEQALPVAHGAGVELHLETDLAPQEFADFLSLLPDPFVRVNYDIGNSSGLGFNPHDELQAYGHRLGSVHIKDRVQGGSTVRLGTGDADISGVFEELARLEYQGPFVLQVARGESGHEQEYMSSVVSQARTWIASLGQPTP